MPLRHGPVFENVEGPTGRVQRIRTVADPLPPDVADVLGAAGRSARGWVLAPVAGEVRDSWLGHIPPEAVVAVGWQGFLRSFLPDGSVARREPKRSPLLTRADIVSVSRDDLAPDAAVGHLVDLLAPRATLVVTHGGLGGIVFGPEVGGRRRLRRYPAVPARTVVDVTGAGDTFLRTARSAS